MTILRSRPVADQSGFTLVELMISITLLTVVTGTVLTGVLDMTRLNETVTNRTDMHNGVRNATELLTQEVGQAGRISLPDGVTLTTATALVGVPTTFDVSSTDQMFIGERLIIGTADVQETVAIANIAGSTISVNSLDYQHAAGTIVRVAGGFAAGVVPDNMANGSTPTRLKIFGDINGDGQMVYVEYWCDIDPNANLGRLYRNSMPFTQNGKPQPTVEQILIDNVQLNPPGPNGVRPDCFTYQRQTVTGTTYIVDVAITLTVRTQRIDPVTKQPQTETKALLNVSPRNVFNVWQLASLGVNNRIHPMPATVQALLP